MPWRLIANTSILLRHHEQRSLQPICRRLVARQAGGATHSAVGPQEGHHPQDTATFTDPRTRGSLIAHMRGAETSLGWTRVGAGPHSPSRVRVRVGSECLTKDDRAAGVRIAL